MEDLSGKKLLILGGAPNEISLVVRAREQGIYVIVADYHKDRALSPAKDYADEAWDISWLDLDALELKCKVVGVDGVLAGYSEIRMEMVIRLCQRLALPCYCNMEQLEITRDKVKFKNVCRQNGVPVVKEYACVEDVEQYPVIVKPVDRAGSIGITVATNREELEAAYQYAMEMSISKHVIIEEYICDSTKIDVYYQIVDGEILFVSGNDVIVAKDNGLNRVVQSAWLLPSVHLPQFQVKIDPSMQKMIRSMGIKNGYIFFSGFVNDREEFAFFECGFRLCGGHYYDYFHKIGAYHTLDMLISHALTGSARNAELHRNPNPRLKCTTINLYAKAGQIATITGIDAVRKMDNCLMALQQARIGQCCRSDTAILSKIAIVHMCSESACDLAADVEKMYSLIETNGTEGEDMIYDRVDPEVILQWWK